MSDSSQFYPVAAAVGCHSHNNVRGDAALRYVDAAVLFVRTVFSVDRVHCHFVQVSVLHDANC